MAIARIKKIEILAHQASKNNLLEEVQRLGVMEISEVKDQKEALTTKAAKSEVSSQRLHHAIDILNKAQPPKEGLLEKLIKVKVQMQEDELNSLLDKDKVYSLLSKLELIEERLRDLDRRDTETNNKIHLLLPWQILKIKLDSLHYTKRCGLVIGTVGRRFQDELLKELGAKLKYYFTEEVSANKKDANTLIIYLKDEFQALEKVLEQYNFQVVSLPIEPKEVTLLLDDLEKKKDAYKIERQELKEEINKISQERLRILASADHYSSAEEKARAESRVHLTSASFLIQGWIREDVLKGFRKKLEKKFKELVIFVNDPAPDDEVPIALENKGIFKPFEVVTDLYGKPVYNGIDPTGFLTIFFIIGFAYCLTDAGYGLIILIASMLASRAFKKAPSAKKFFDMFSWCGLATVILGGLTGSWFGNIIDKLPSALSGITGLKNHIMVIDPIKNPLVFLVGALVIGVIQVAFGVLIKFIYEIRNKNYFNAFFRDLAALGAQLSLVALVVSSAGVLPKVMTKPFLGTLAVAIGAIMVYQWRVNDKMGLKLFWILFGPYSVITGNFLSDTLSYSRLFALGLTTGLLATAINEICFLIPGMMTPLGIPAVVGVILGVVIFIFAHLMNIAINILGAYVHTSRLQYLEFFTKFFEGGGRPFEPLKKTEEYTIVNYN